MKYTAVSGPDTSKLIGSWVRPDGGYLLEIKSIDKGGSMQATYFN